MTHSPIEAAIRQANARGQTALIPYLTVGFPRREDTRALVPALVEGGACVIELGVPFSDPLADGPTIQEASMVALENGVTLGTCLETVADLRGDGVTVPLVLMGYYNPFLAYGLVRLVEDAARAGLDGFIVVDLPAEEAGPLQQACRGWGLDLICLLAPTSTDQRIAQGCENAQGFIYCVSLTGVTGARDQLPPGFPDLVARIRRHTELPIAVGFGISRPEHVQAVGQHAHAAVVGSALIAAVRRAPAGEEARVARDFVASLGETPTPASRRTP